MTITGTATPVRQGAHLPTALAFRSPFAPSIVPYRATSATSHATIANFGLYTFDIQPYMAFQKGTRVRAISSPTGSWMEGVVKTYNGTQLSIIPDRAFIPAAGPYANWVITVSGEVQLNRLVVTSGEIVNATLVESNYLGAATFSLRTLLGGTEPSPTNPITFQAPNGRTRVIDAPLSITLPYLATLGVLYPGMPFRLWFALVDDPGYDAHIGVMQTRDFATNGIFAFQGRAVANTLTPPGNLSGIFYSDITLTDKSYAVIGFMDYDDGLSTPGIWNVAPNRFVFFANGNPLPGDTIGVTAKQVSTPSSHPQLTPIDNSVPQLTEGAEVLGYDVTPLNRISVLTVEAQVHLWSESTELVAALHMSTQNNAVATTWGSSGRNPVQLQYNAFLGNTNTVTFSVRAGRGVDVGNQLGFNAVTNPYSGFYGGTFNSFIRITERMT